MDTPGPIWGNLLLQIILIAINAFFASTEIAVISLNENKLKRQLEEGDQKAARLLRMVESPSQFLSTIQIGITLAGYLGSAFAASTFAAPLAVWLQEIGLSFASLATLETICVVVITLILSYFTLVFGELVPKRVAMQHSDKVARFASGVIHGLATVMKPIIWFLTISTNGVLRLMRINPNNESEPVTEEEIRMMVDVGQEKGVIEDVQKEMINNIFEFDDIDVADIMTHRTDMACIDVEDSLSDAIKLAIDEGYSRIPVYEEDPDNIVGIIYIKDLLKYVGTSLPKTKGLKDIMREAYFVPESKRCGALFSEMTEKHIQMAIVVDEYGGTAGLVTLEDIVEAIVGNIQDEYDNEDEEISKINETTFTIDGITDLEEVEEQLGIKFPKDDYDTLGGFIISRLGFLPQDGEMNTVEYENIRFTVLNVEERRIGKVKVEILPKPENAEDVPAEEKKSIFERGRKEEKDKEKEKDDED